MKNDKNGKLSKAIENLKTDIRSFKKQGIALGKIFNLVGNDCYILSALEEVELANFESLEQGNEILNKTREEVAKEIVRKDSVKFPKCDYHRL